MLIAILACEIGFWVAIALGLITRYPLNRPRLGKALLYSTPLIDVLLLSFVVIHLRSGVEPHLTHGIAALYIGFSIAFGHQVIERADRTYRRKINKESVPEPQRGTPMQREIQSFGRALLAAAVAAAIIEITILAASNPMVAKTLRSWHQTLLIILGIWLVAGPVWQFFSPTPKASAVNHNSKHDKTSSFSG